MERNDLPVVVEIERSPTETGRLRDELRIPVNRVFGGTMGCIMADGAHVDVVCIMSRLNGDDF